MMEVKRSIVTPHRVSQTFYNSLAKQICTPVLCYKNSNILPIFQGGVANFRLHFLSQFFFNFENLSAHLVANILNFPKHPQLLHFG